MVIQRNPEPGRQAVLWLATAVVMLIGATGCAVIILAAVENPAFHLALWGGLFGSGGADDLVVNPSRPEFLKTMAPFLAFCT